MTPVAPARRWIKHALGGAITLLCLAVIAHKVDGAALLAALEHANWWYLLPAIGALAFGYAMRILRWSLLLRSAGPHVTFGHCVAPFLGAIALNNVLPLRLGDVVRALVFPAYLGVSRTSATSGLVMERLIDLMTLLVCLSLGLLAIPHATLPPLIARSALTLALGGGVLLAAGFLFSAPLARWLRAQPRQPQQPQHPRQPRQHPQPRQARRVRLANLLDTASDLLDGFAAMARAPVLALALLISMLVWVGEAGLFYGVLRALGLPATPVMALLVMAIATLSTLVPSSPGYVGPFHLAAFSAIALVGGTSAQAGSFAVLAHLALWVPTSLAGALAMLSRPAMFRRARRATLAALPIQLPIELPTELPTELPIK